MGLGLVVASNTQSIFPLHDLASQGTWIKGSKLPARGASNSRLTSTNARRGVIGTAEQRADDLHSLMSVSFPELPSKPTKEMKKKKLRGGI